MSRLHRNDTKGYHSLAIDINNGIFMVVKKSTGLVSPIHVQKSMKLQKFVCTNQSNIKILVDEADSLTTRAISRTKAYFDTNYYLKILRT